MDPLLLFGLSMLLVAFAISAVHNRNKPVTEAPRAVLRRCRLELQAIRDELAKFPATREIHDLVDDTWRQESTITRVEAELEAKAQ